MMNKRTVAQATWSEISLGLVFFRNKTFNHMFVEVKWKYYDFSVKYVISSHQQERLPAVS